jgi:hypothetical protein
MKPFRKDALYVIAIACDGLLAAARPNQVRVQIPLPRLAERDICKRRAFVLGVLAQAAGLVLRGVRVLPSTDLS